MSVQIEVQRDDRWSPPSRGVLKINTNGSSRGNPRPARIGGIVRDIFGRDIFFFSIHKGQQYNNLMVGLTILVAIERACTLRW